MAGRTGRGTWRNGDGLEILWQPQGVGVHGNEMPAGVSFCRLPCPVADIEVAAHVDLSDASPLDLSPASICTARLSFDEVGAVTLRCGDGVRLSARAARGSAELLAYRDFFGQHS